MGAGVMDMQPPTTGLIDALHKLLGGAGTAVVAATVGRLMWHANEVRSGRRPAFGVFLLWETPMAIGMALIGDGAGEYFNLTDTQTVSLIAVLSYLGPRGVFHVLEKWWSGKSK